MDFGYAGKILHVDLSSRKVWKESLDEEMARTYVGGRGINARLLWDGVKADTDPLGPENLLVFGAGPLIGTTAPTGSRTSLAFRSPLTNRYAKGSGGGFWGAQLRFAGYDHLVIHGAAETPVYILIDNDRIEIRDAAKLCGLAISATCKAVVAELGMPDLEVAAIGPAGENLVKYANIMLSAGYSIGRGGGGAVMGSKNLKAIAVRGTGSLKIADPARFKEAAKAVHRAVAKDPFAQGLYMFGPSGFVGAWDQMEILPTRNWQQGRIEGVELLTGQTFVEKGYLRARGSCSACTIGCRRNLKITSGRFAGTTCLTIEHEQSTDFGANVGVADTEALIAASGLANELGLDCASTGTTIAWAMESVQRGVLSKKDVDGLDMTWGNADAVIAMIKKIANREGIGDLLAEGLVRASERVGKDSWKWAVVSGGLEHPGMDVRGSKGYALGNAVNPRGGDHCTSAPVAEYGLTPDGIELIKEITGDAQYANPVLYDKRAEIVRWHEDVYVAVDSLGVCTFASLCAVGFTPELMAELYSAGTGIPLDVEDLMTLGWRVVSLERAFNMRDGLDRRDDQVPYRFQHDPVQSGLYKGEVVSPEKFDEMLDEYYTLREWDVATGRPTTATLNKLGLRDVAEALAG